MAAKDAIREKLLPALLDVDASKFVGDFRALLSHSVKGGGLNVRNPVEGAMRLHQSSAEASSVLVKSLREGSALNGIEHKQCVQKAGTEARKERTEAEKAKVGEMVEEAGRAVTPRPSPL